MNAKLSELPYTLPKVLYDRLAFSIINNQNNQPNSKTTPRTSAEIITGEKFNFFAYKPPSVALYWSFTVGVTIKERDWYLFLMSKRSPKCGVGFKACQ